jgi:hypothetical protein
LVIFARNPTLKGGQAIHAGFAAPKIAKRLDPAAARPVLIAKAQVREEKRIPP